MICKRSRGSAETAADQLDCLDWEGRSGASPLPMIAVPGFAAPPSIPIFGPPVCYDGHPGSDFILAPGTMQTGVPVNAAAAGFVVQISTGNPDTCFADPKNNFQINCPGGKIVANFVHVRQDDGRVAMYYHLRNTPPPVAVGDRIVCGQFIGQVGSSGQSSLPHLHFELRELPKDTPFIEDVDGVVRRTGAIIDPYPDSWASTIPTPSGIVPLPVCK